MLDTAASDLEILLGSLLALVLGGVVGWEREAAEKGAGLRTNMLVCFGAYLFVAVAEAIVPFTEATLGADLVQTDPVRIVQSIVVGVSFVGAGVVFRDPERGRTRGLTTAASLLVVAPIGVGVALGRYVLAIGAALLTVAVLRGVNHLEARFFEHDEEPENDAPSDDPPDGS